MLRNTQIGLRCALLLCVSAVTVGAAAAETRTVTVRLAPAVVTQPVTGRLYVFVSKQPSGEPMRGSNWFAPEPFFSTTVRNVTGGDRISVDDTAHGFPVALAKLPAGKYRLQAVLDHDFYDPQPAQGVGNYYSDVREWEFSAEAVTGPELELDKVVAPRPFPTSKWVEEIVFRSETLSKFHRREVVERAAIVFPASYYDEPHRKYPVIYSIPGFGGDHRGAQKYTEKPPEPRPGEAEFIRVFLSGRCKWGHHVYADSATNGPRGECLVREMIPYLDRTYRTLNVPEARFLTGHSSGGWSSLWLQVTYPEFFGGVWSSSPDPVDFRDYQQVNLYADPPLSLFTDPTGSRRPIARRGDKVALWYDNFSHMDDTLICGGQLRSFEAVFSPLDAEGLPAKLWDRETGRIDPAIAQSWQKYDLRLKLERNWDRLRPLLAGKLHITMGTRDTFYLNGATELLAERLHQLGSDADVKFVPGADHGGILTTEYRQRLLHEMSDRFLQRHGGKPAAE